MTLYRACLACVVSVALVACRDNPKGVLQPLAPLAGLRYVNLVNDTGAVDFRIVNFIGDAPVAGAAAFRTGGSPNGIATNFLPYHWPVEAGRDVDIRVFMNGLDPAVSSTVIFDTTVTFTQNVNYTFYLYGSARTAGGVHALITSDTVPNLTGTQLGFRVIHLGGTAMGNQDVDIAAAAATSPLAGTAQFANIAPGTVTGYITSVAAAAAGYKAVVSTPASRTFTTFFAAAPAGVVGTTTLNPVAGVAVAGSAFSVVIVPASVVGSAAPQTAAYLAPTVLFLVDKKPALTAP